MREGDVAEDMRSHLPLSRSAHDRRAELRNNPAAIDALWQHEETRVLLLHDGRTLMRENSIVSVPVADVPEAATTLFLGTSTAAGGNHAADVTFFASILSDEQDAERFATATGSRWGDLRVSAPDLSELEIGLFAQALGLANWHDSHRYAPQSGAAVAAADAGWVLRDADAQHSVFPRTDAAIIVAVYDADDRILLGNNAMWDAKRFSLLAGYVEPGESLENAVIREVFEESGLTVTNPRYLGSQPWPFPASLMLGFEARLADGVNPDDISPDGEEILHLRWFTRAELLAALDDEILMPGRSAIARYIIENWLGEKMDQPDSWRDKR